LIILIAEMKKKINWYARVKIIYKI